MSIVTLKNKTATKYRPKISGKRPGGEWVQHGPFGKDNSSLPIYGAQGFSLNGGMRSISVGASFPIGKNGTPYRGQHPIGHGGYRGQYKQAEPLFNSGIATVEIAGNQHRYIKPSVLSTRGMLRGRYRWVYSGTYPNYWVQPVYPHGTMHENKSQGMYIKNRCSNSC